jgi:hypothetical protein
MTATAAPLAGDVAARPPADPAPRDDATASDDAADTRSVSVRRWNAPWYLSPFGYLPVSGDGPWRRP